MSHVCFITFHHFLKFFGGDHLRVATMSLSKGWHLHEPIKFSATSKRLGHFSNLPDLPSILMTFSGLRDRSWLHPYLIDPLSRSDFSNTERIAQHRVDVILGAKQCISSSRTGPNSFPGSKYQHEEDLR